LIELDAFEIKNMLKIATVESRSRHYILSKI